MRIAILATAAIFIGAGAAQAQVSCSALLEVACLQQLGLASDDKVTGDCGAQLNNYRGCLAKAAATASRGRADPETRCSEARAGRLWSDAKGSNSCIALKSFRDACPASPEASFAKGLMQQMGCRKGDLAAPSGGADGGDVAGGGAAGAGAEPAGRIGPFDGVWVARIENNARCPKPGGRIVLKISGREVQGKSGDGRDFSGTVKRDGSIVFTGMNGLRNATVTFKGRLEGESGSGETEIMRRGCQGQIAFKKF